MTGFLPPTGDPVDPEVHLWRVRDDVEGLATCNVCGSADPDMKKHLDCFVALSWDDVDLERQVEFDRRDRYYDGR